MEQGARPFQRELEPELVKQIYIKGSKEPGARSFLEGARAESREPVKKGTGSPTLKDMYVHQNNHQVVAIGKNIPEKKYPGLWKDMVSCSISKAPPTR